MSNIIINPYINAAGSVDPALVGWWDASDITTLFQNEAGTVPVTTDGQEVMHWKDKSGNGIDVTSPTGKQCYYKDTIGGAPGSVEGRDANDGFFYRAENALSQSHYVTVFAVVRATGTIGCLWSTLGSSSSAPGMKLYLAQNNTLTNRRSMEIYDSSGSRTSYLQNNHSLNTWYVITGFANKDILQVNNRIGGVEGYRGLSTGDFNCHNTNTRIMNHYSTQSSFKGFMGELKLYDRLMTTEEMIAEEVALRSKWSAL